MWGYWLGVLVKKGAALSIPLSLSHSLKLTNGYIIVEAIDYSVFSCFFSSGVFLLCVTILFLFGAAILAYVAHTIWRPTWHLANASSYLLHTDESSIPFYSTSNRYKYKQ